VARRAALRGTGLHTGATTEATFLPAPAGQGIVFRRTDLPGTPEVPARLTEVEAVERRTAIGHGEATIHTVEHLLSAVAAHGIDDLTVELTGPEPPILDGSVQPYFDALQQAEPTLVGGEAVVGLTVTVSDACDVLNVFPILNIIPLWPGCVPVTITGDIVRRRPVAAAAP